MMMAWWACCRFAICCALSSANRAMPLSCFTNTSRTEKLAKVWLYSRLKNFVEKTDRTASKSVLSIMLRCASEEGEDEYQLQATRPFQFATDLRLKLSGNGPAASSKGTRPAESHQL